MKATMAMAAPPGKFLIARRDRGEWDIAEMHALAFGRNCYLRLRTSIGTITIYAPAETMIAKLQEALAFFHLPGPNGDKNSGQAAASVTKYHIANFRNVSLDEISPETMIEIFYATPSLSFVARDFEAFIIEHFNLNPDVLTVRRKLSIEDLFGPDGKPVRGAQTRIAEALGVTNAGGHRKRIQAVLAELQNKHSTTAKKSTRGAEWAA